MGNTNIGGFFTNDYLIVEGFGELKFKDVYCFSLALAAKCNAIRTKYKFAKKTYLAVTLFYNTCFASKDAKAGNTDYERTQLAAIIKF